MPDKLETFVINIAIIEGRHYIWPNMNSTVMVKIDNQKKCTAVKFNTDCPYYNEYFVFEFLETIDNILGKNVTITVIKPGSILRKRKVLGLVTFDVPTIWYQEDHQVYHKWAVLTAPTKDYVTSTRGYLKLDVSILSKGQLPKIPIIEDTDDIETNLFLPEGVTIQRQRINFIFDVYRAAELIKKNPIQEGAKRLEPPSNVYLQISFSGTNNKTAVRKNTSSPVWNERLILSEWFPPLCQRFTIELYHDGNRRTVRYLNLRSISNDKEEGFLPTFGPAFIHFYSPNHLEGYLGKVLVSLQTTLLGDLEEYEGRNYTESEVAPIREDYFLKFENVVVFATIFEVSSISRKFNDKAISFRISCGPIQADEGTAISPPIKPKILNRNYCYLPIGNSKPCLHLALTLPDIRKRIFNHNLLLKILNQLKSRLTNIEDIFHNKDYKIASDETESSLLEILDFISSSAAKYIDMASNYNLDEGPLLDKERMKVSLREMDKIAFLVQSISSNQSKRKIFQKIEKIYTRIEALIDIVEDWPQIYIWMIYGSKRVAYSIIQARNVLHSPIDDEKGVDCGALRSIYFQTEDNQASDFITSVCKMDIMVWMGLPRHLASYLPSGFMFSSEVIPKNLVSEERHYFQARAHIFQGRFTPGADKTGLCDPVVHVIINSQFRQTQVLRKILTPIWDQTLNFQTVVLYGSIEFIKTYPPSVIIEVYDKDECNKFEFVGKTVITPIIKTKEEPHNPPKLSWYHIYNKFDVSAEILTVVELLQLSHQYEVFEDIKTIVKIPPEITPNLVNHRIEVFFWGVRKLKKVHLCQINRPKIVLDCANSTLTSDTILNAGKFANFTNPMKIFETHLPEQQEYAPPLCLKMYDCRNFGISVYGGIHILPIQQFVYHPLSAIERNSILMDFRQDSLEFTPSIDSVMQRLKEAVESKEKVHVEIEVKRNKCKKILQKICCKKEVKKEQPVKIVKVVEEEEWEDSSDFDWWTKFYASLEETPTTGKVPLSHRYKLKIYPNELEKQPEFEEFTDTLACFSMYKGKRTGDEAVDEENTTGVFKGALRIYKWPLSSPDYVTKNGLPLEKGVFQDFPTNASLRYVLRIYCVRGLNLKPKDPNGKSDPYIMIKLNEKTINDRNNKIMGQVNPIFGRCFELTGIFPQDHTVTVSVMDWDVVTADDLIGQTKIDLENRFYSKHRAFCGIAQDYLTSGYCQWRGQQKPDQILDILCLKYHIPDVEYGPTFVTIAGRKFSPENFTASKNVDLDRQILALHVLKHWSQIPLVGFHLVPEHVETRSLFNPQQPGIEQGKLQMWIDILPVINRPTPKQVNIAPRKPLEYELRVIVWNAENVRLEERDILTSKQKADVYVKGWLIDPDRSQYTDVHYRSLTGEANFNWRFIFNFLYLSSENKIVIKKKTLFSSGETEEKLPCKLNLQTWDNDTFSFNDFLGVVTLELSKLPKGASSSKKCNLELLKPKTRYLNLFKIRRTKGWWPLKSFNQATKEEVYGGCLELEFEMLTKEEAEKSPAGFGRNDPQGLPKPNRPETSFSLFSNPLKAFKYTVKLFKGKIIKVVVLVVIILIAVGIVYALSKYGIQGIGEKIKKVTSSIHT